MWRWQWLRKAGPCIKLQAEGRYISTEWKVTVRGAALLTRSELMEGETIFTVIINSVCAVQCNGDHCLYTTRSHVAVSACHYKWDKMTQAKCAQSQLAHSHYVPYYYAHPCSQQKPDLHCILIQNV